MKNRIIKLAWTTASVFITVVPQALAAGGGGGSANTTCNNSICHTGNNLGTTILQVVGLFLIVLVAVKGLKNLAKEKYAALAVDILVAIPLAVFIFSPATAESFLKGAANIFSA